MIRIATAFLLSAVPPPISSTPFCTTVPPMLYSEIIKAAELIVTGTATHSVSRIEEGGKTIRTYTTFDRLTWHKGKPQPALTLRLEGGQVGDDRLCIHEMPELKVGARYLLYVAANGTNLSPIVGFYQGAFELVNREGREILVSLKGQELIGIAKDRFLFAGKPEPRHASHAGPEIMPVAGFTPKLAEPDAEQRQAAERQRIEAHDAARGPRGLPEIFVPSSGSGSARGASAPPQSSPVAAANSTPDGVPDAGSDKSPIVIPHALDRGLRTSKEALLDPARLEGRR